MSKRPQEYWYVHGEAYDLRAFCEVHPGGKEQLMVTQGRDCTEMVHSMHSMASIDKVKQTLAKYKVENVKVEDDSEIFAWKEDGLYATLTRRVRDYIKSLGPNETHKASNLFWVIAGIEMCLYAFMFYLWIFKGSYLAPLIAGLMAVSLGFMIFHTSGHCGMSKNPKVNSFWYKVFANYILGFIDVLWDLHHNYGHHSYTNIHRKDPDVSNSYAFVRKSEHQKKKPIHKKQWYIAYLMLVFFPNQWFGQVIQYFLATFRKKMFGVPMIHKAEKSRTPFVVFFGIIVNLAALIVAQQGVIFAIISLYLYSFGCGFAYWACVFPNHDTDLSHQSSIDQVKNGENDWGAHQIQHSSNFRMPVFLAYFIGGMNFQIEHHLFPAVHPRHYPAISKFVREECAKRNIDYHLHSSWFDALRGNFKHLRDMAERE